MVQWRWSADLHGKGYIPPLRGGLGPGYSPLFYCPGPGILRECVRGGFYSFSLGVAKSDFYVVVIRLWLRRVAFRCDLWPCLGAYWPLLLRGVR